LCLFVGLYCLDVEGSKGCINIEDGIEFSLLSDGIDELLWLLGVDQIDGLLENFNGVLEFFYLTTGILYLKRLFPLSLRAVYCCIFDLF
jgi:hypothetical protein